VQSSLKTVLLLVAASLFTSAAAHGQISGSLKGRITDSANAVIAGARVTATEVDTGLSRTAVSAPNGEYVFPQLHPGLYRVTVTANNFRQMIREGITVLTGATDSADMSLTVGSALQSVTVSSDVPLLQSETSNIQTTIPGHTVTALPLNGRNFVQLATLAPGVSLPPGTVLPRINGGRPRTNEYLFDGISALQPEPGQVAFFPILDDIQEFTVEANNVPAEFGRFNGGVVNLSTRSGSNTIHASLYDFFRNEALNARNYFSRYPARKPEYRRNQYGATLGAPILRNRLFFFGGYEGEKFLEGVTRLSTVPTMAQRQGIFTGAHIYDPSTTFFNGSRYVRKEFPNDVIDKPFDPTAAALLRRFPLPTNPTATANNYTRTANDAVHQNQLDARIDGAFRQKDRAFLRYSYFHEVEQPVTPLPDGSGAIVGTLLGTGNVAGLSNVTGQQAVFNETHTVGDRMLNDFRFGYTRRANAIRGTILGGSASQVLSIPGIPENAAFSNALPSFLITGIQQLGPSAGTFSQYQTAVTQLVDTFSFNHSAHAVKFGADLRWYQLNAIAPPSPSGSFAFTTTGTNQQGVNGTGNAIASFLLGQVDSFQIDLQGSRIRPRDFIEEYFLQDDWKALPNLTVNVGARWTLHHPSTERNNQGAVFNLATQQLQYLGRDGVPRSARELHWNNVAPRIGLAYLLNPRTVIRSGYGIVFIDQSGITTPFTTPQFPFIQNVAQKTQDSVNAAFALSAGPSVAPLALTPDAGLGQSVYTVKQSQGSGYTQQWNLAVQRELTSNLSFEVAYVGSHIIRVGIPDSNINQLTAQQLSLGAALQAPVANPYYGQIPASSSIGGKTISYAQSIKPYPRFLNVAYYRNNTGQTNYNAIEAKVEQRLSQGLSMLFSYTHSKLIDDASAVFSSTVLSSPNSNSLVAADAYRPYLERDSSTGDTPNVLVASSTYQLPTVATRHAGSFGPGKALLRGWAVNAIFTMQSGMPVAITQATNTLAFAGFVLQRPDIIGKVNLPDARRTPARFFNTSAFQAAKPFALGDASRDPVRGPAFRDLDLAMVKHTALSEKTDLEFRAEVFNVTNTPAFGQPNGSFGSPAFGSIATTVSDPRVVQFAIRWSR